ncbi:MAG: hypothetical protein KC766_21350, partial [Myxococcales bacterium]|nr:hypothetical protein [Myxococcales bacterium]
MKTRLLILTSILALSASTVACSSDDDGGGSGGTGNAGSGGTGNGGTGGGSGGSGATGGSGGGTTLPMDACVDLQTEYEAEYDGKTIADIATDCGRNSCI